MSKKAATEGELAELHSKVARAMSELLTTDPNPALLGVITKFLKDNEITAVIDESEEMTDLAKKLAEKKQRKAVGNVIPMAMDDD